MMDHTLISRITEHPLYSRIKSECTEMGCASKKHIVTAASGGGDSTALALLITPFASANKCNHILAYFDHGIDRNRHEKEWEFITEMARRLSIRAVRGQTREYEHIGGEGPEDRLRNRRYAFLRDVAGDQGMILTAHTRDDNAESFILAAVRGSPGSGLSGIRPVRSDCIMRPLLSVSRASLREFLRSLNMRWIEDPTNDDISGARNYIRHAIIPGLVEKFGSEAVTGLHRSARNHDRDNSYINSLMKTVMNDLLCIEESGERVLDLTALGKYHEAVQHRVLLAIFDMLYRGERVSVTPHLEGLKQVIRGNVRSVSFPKGIQIRREGSELVIVPPERRLFTRPIQEPLSIPGLTPLPAIGGGIQSSIVWTPPGNMPVLPRDTGSALIDVDELVGSLYIRYRRRGERFTPLGFSYGKVKLKKYLRDKGIPRNQRWLYPIIAERVSGRLVWIPGIARSTIGRISDRTKRYVHLRFFTNH